MRVASAALVPSVALAVAGCGDNAPQPKVRSASFRFVSVVGGFGSCAGRGAYDFRRRLGGVSLDCSKLGGGHLRFLEIGDEVYFGVGRFVGQKRWIVSHVRGGPQSIIGAIGGFDPFYGRGPAEMLEYLRSHGGGVSKVGSETVRGVQTTRYRGTLPGARHERLDVSLWADADGRVRRIRTRYPSGASLTVTVDLVRFDVPVTTAAPPRSTVMTDAEYEAYARKQLKHRFGGLLHLYGPG
jgi:hypothetical protein